MQKTYRGSCHCGAVRFEVDVDLTHETSRCNCSICRKLRLWKFQAAPEKVRLLQGHEAMSEYRFGSQSVQHQFCRTCGVKLFGRGIINGNPFVVVSVTTLDDATDQELSDARIVYQDGRNDAFESVPSATRYM